MRRQEENVEVELTVDAAMAGGVLVVDEIVSRSPLFAPKAVSVVGTPRGLVASGIGMPGKRRLGPN